MSADFFPLDIVLETAPRQDGTRPTARALNRPEPVRLGLPLPRGLVAAPEELDLIAVGPDGSETYRRPACDFTPLARWPDGSLQWVLLRHTAEPLASSAANTQDAFPRYRVVRREGVAPLQTAPAALVLHDLGDAYAVETGSPEGVRFVIDKNWLYPVRQIHRGGRALLREGNPPALLTDTHGKAYRFRIDRFTIEHAGRAQIDICCEGALIAADSQTQGEAFCRGECRLFFFAGTPLLKIEFALWNPRPAQHAGGLWDLGDPHSAYFKHLRFAFPLAMPAAGETSEGATELSAFLHLDPEAAGPAEAKPGFALSLRDLASFPAGAIADVHQSSSGFDSWSSLANVDRHNQVTARFRGYRAQVLQAESPAPGVTSSGPLLLTGDHAQPVVGMVSNRGLGLALACEHFWETYPNRLALEATGKGHLDLVYEPFPAAEAAEFELQGGEMAPCTLWLDAGQVSAPATTLLAARVPLVARLKPEAYCAAQVFPFASQRALTDDAFWQNLGHAFLEGEDAIFARQRRFEEFGWRNFGEFPADHERQHYPGQGEFVSHYNNQYDLILACLVQFAGQGDARWHKLACDLSRHVMHIDLYRTEGDKSAFNGGYYWHTAHYMHAGTATHRSYSRQGLGGKPVPAGFGGGPSNEHNYTTGLLLYHYLTGDARAKRCLLQLASWVKTMQDGSKTVFRFLSANPTGLATATRELAYQGPGRGGGYSINACLDAFALTGEESWLALAEKTLRTCLGPGDDPAELELHDRERRWSYVVFLQAVGKFLDVKRSRGERDGGFAHARACLLKLADWMSRHEYPYLDKPADLEYPTSTWAAQDLRKACVFLYAARYAPSREIAGAYMDKAATFVAASKAYLAGFDDRATVRNMVLILNHLPMFSLAQPSSAEDWWLGLPESALSPEALATKGLRVVPQKIEAMERAKRMIKTLGLAAVPIAFALWRDYRAGRRSA